MNSDFDHDDLRLLLDGLDTLEGKAGTDALLGTLMVGMLTPNKENRDQFVDEQKKERKRKEPEAKALKDSITVLKGKLISYRKSLDSATAEQVLADI